MADIAMNIAAQTAWLDREIYRLNNRLLAGAPVENEQAVKELLAMFRHRKKIRRIRT